MTLPSHMALTSGWALTPPLTLTFEVPGTSSSGRSPGVTASLLKNLISILTLIRLILTSRIKSSWVLQHPQEEHFLM